MTPPSPSEPWSARLLAAVPLVWGMMLATAGPAGSASPAQNPPRAGTPGMVAAATVVLGPGLRLSLRGARNSSEAPAVPGADHPEGIVLRLRRGCLDLSPRAFDLLCRP